MRGQVSQFYRLGVIYTESTKNLTSMKPSSNSFYSLLLTVTAIGSMALGAFVMSALTAGPLHAAGQWMQKVSLSGNSAKTVEKKIKIGSFSQIKAGQAIDIIFTQGQSTGEAIITAPEAWFKTLAISTTNDILDIRYDSKEGVIQGKITVKVASPELSSIQMATAASFESTAPFISSRALAIDASSAADVSFGEIIVPSLTIEAESASSVNILSLDAEEIEVNAASAASVKLKEISSPVIKANAKSAAEVFLSGRCNSAEITSHSGGEVKRRGLIRETLPITPRKK